MATHGVRYGAGTALAIVQLHLGHKLRHLELGFPYTDRLNDQDDLIGDFTAATKAIAMIIHAEDVVNNVFLGPQIISRVL